MSSLQIGRLLIGPPLQWYEQVGDPATTLGGGVVPNTRTAPAFALSIGTPAADGQADTVAARLAIRRQLRSMLNNSPMKYEGWIYIVYSDDPEQDGWYVPDQMQFQDLSSPMGLATGWWNLNGNFYLVGHQRTHREARQVWMKDLRTGLFEKDTLGWLVTADFAALPIQQLSVLPHGATNAINTTNQQVVGGGALPAGHDTGSCQVITGQSDLTVISYERPESSIGLSDVVVYDRRGQITAPGAGPDTNWEEVYGPDWQWNWTQQATPTPDTPVIDNQLVRVRYDGTNTPGFRIDMWTGTAYVEQGKIIFERIGDSINLDNVWVTAGLQEYTPERAIMWVHLSNATDIFSGERIYVTVTRGQLGCDIECYPGLKSAGGQADVQFEYSMNGPDSNDSIMFEPSVTIPPTTGTDTIWGSAISNNWASASGTFSNALPAAATTENYVSVLRCPSSPLTVGPWQVNFLVGQQHTAFRGSSTANGYGGTAQRVVQIFGQGGMGYLATEIAFTPTVANQVSNVGTWSPSPAQASQFRVFGGLSTTWTDFGEYTGVAVSVGTSTRVEAYLTQDRTRAGAIFAGSRDQAQSALTDSRMKGAVVAR